ncbi:glycine zipper 2TM domain-containing protein, partial [Frateuria sp.]|uniref:glycine zipper 2TM domain-containing protein n=1 Tax=Frateuria sp. TaxID=2211372 RepID=UPI003F816F13
LVGHAVFVTKTAPPTPHPHSAGPALGAVAGGLLGHQVGGGKGKTLATVAGAVAGGYAGKKIQENRQEAKVTTTTERKCETVNDSSTKVVGYNVRYEYNGVTRTTRMDHDPGDRVQVQEGVVSVSDAQ